MSQLHQRHLQESSEQEQEVLVVKRALVDREQQLSRLEKQIESEKNKHDEYEAVISDVTSEAAKAKKRLEEEVLAVSNSTSETILSFKEKIAALTSQHESEREQWSAKERGLRHSGEENRLQLLELQNDKGSLAEKYDALLTDSNSLKTKLVNMELMVKESQELASAQQCSAADQMSDLACRHNEQISAHVREEERLKLLVVESTSSFTSLSEKYTELVTFKTEEESSVQYSLSAELSAFKDECENLRYVFDHLCLRMTVNLSMLVVPDWKCMLFKKLIYKPPKSLMSPLKSILKQCVKWKSAIKRKLDLWRTNAKLSLKLLVSNSN
jgi:hypothetical protein